MEELDMNYLCSVMGSLSGVPIRLSGETMPGPCAGKNGGNTNDEDHFD